MIEFEQLYWLWLFFPLLLFWLLLWLIWQSGYRSMIGYFGKERLAMLISGFNYPVEVIRKVLLLLALGLFVVALVNPRSGIERSEVTTESVNIIIALDLSYSMLAEDRSPNRLEVSKQRAMELIDLLPGNHFAYMPFAGSPELQVPLTTDIDGLKTAIRSSRTGMLPLQGTSFAALLDEAQDYLDRQGSGVLVVFTDGEDHGPEFQGSLLQMKKKRFPVFSILTGTEEGAPIPWRTASGGPYRMDIDGNRINTRMELEPMGQITTETGGLLLENPGPAEMARMAQRINEFRQSGIAQGSYTVYADYYAFMILAGFLFLVFYQFAPIIMAGRVKKNFQ
ncbi:MAG: VWA domain-containing protein [Saprospirales bacterium]|nr:MAG: VWA domain-containing protein [Saprospirales bacterium]